MSAIEHFYCRLVDGLSKNLGILAAWIVLPLIIATIYEVFSRYVLNAPTIWAYELGYMLTGVNFLLGAAFTLREKAHIRIDVLYTHLTPKWKAVVDLIGYAVLFVPLGFWLSYKLGNYAFDAYVSGQQSGESAWNPVIWPFRVVFFVGFAALTLQATVELIRTVRVFTDRSESTSGGANG